MEGRYDQSGAVAPHLHRSAELRKVYEVRDRKTQELLIRFELGPRSSVVRAPELAETRGKVDWFLRKGAELGFGMLMDVSVDCVEVQGREASAG